MAQHILLKEKDEPKVFEIVKKLTKQILAKINRNTTNFSEVDVELNSKTYTIMKLSSDYLETGDYLAVIIKPLSLQSITDEHPSLIKNIGLECHFGYEENVTSIYWVV